MLKTTRGILALALAAAVTLGACSDIAPTSAPETPSSSSMSSGATGTDNYIVILKSTGDALGKSTMLAKSHGIEVGRLYSSAIEGFSATIPEAKVAELRNDPSVELVEAVQPVTIEQSGTYQALPWGINSIDGDISSTLAGNGSGTVSNVRVYIIDSGIQTHSDLNVVGGRNFVTGMLSTAWGDDHGHGTHVAGTVAARDNSQWVVGVAPGAPLYSLRVLDASGSGNSAIVVSALDWLTAQVRSQKSAGTYLPTVVNMSLGGPASSAVDYAVRTLIAQGVVVVVAAGNENIDAYYSSPARVGEAITVGAIDNYGRKASFSNYGSVVDIQAPGVSIISTYKNGGAAWMSGTSMASPHVAGAAALYLSKSVNRYKTPQQVRDRLVTDARANATGEPYGTTTRSLYIGGKTGYPAVNIY
jgi:aqualysin 1